MRRFQAFSLFFLLVLGLASSVGRALADPPDILNSYKFLPRFSTLRQTGGFAGVDWQFPVFGTYDFVTGFRYESGGETDVIRLRPFAQFANVDAYGAHPTMDPGLSLDWVFNLSGLDGRPVYKSPSGLELYRFEGYVEKIVVDDDPTATRVELLAARLGRWMYLRGHTEPPCCDFFEYELRGVAHQVPFVDLDEDGKVGADDLTLWQDAYGTTSSGRDFLAWQQQYGEEAPSLAEFDALMNEAIVAMGAPSLVSVPEPCAVCLLAAGMLCCCFGRRS